MTIKDGEGFGALAENSFDIITRHGPDFRYLYANSAIEEYTGIRKEDFVGRSYRELGMPEAICVFWDHQLAAVFAERKIQTVEFEMPGGTVYVRSKLVPEFDERGELTSVLVISRELSQQRQTEDRLKHLSSHFQLAAESASVGTWLLDLNSQRLEWSNLHKRMWGYPEEKTDLVFDDWSACIHPADRDRAILRFNESASGQTPYEVEYRIIRSDDESVRWIRSVGKFYFRKNGDADIVTGISIDITPAKESEHRLKESEKRFRATLENAAVGIAHVSPDGKWIFVNSKLCEILGYSESELIRLTFQEITFPQDLEDDLKGVQMLLDGRESTYTLEKRYIKKSGDIFWAQLTVSLVRDAQGIPEYFISIVQDISERKRVERALRESNERYDLINRATQDALWDWNIATGEMRWNEAMHSLFRYKEDAVPKTFEAWCFNIHPDDRDRVIESLYSLLESRGTSWSEKYRYCCGDGSYKIVYDRGFLQTDASGKAVRMVGCMQDVTESEEFLTKLESVVALRTVELQRSNQDLQQFAHVVSHDLKEPIRKIRTFTALLENEFAGNMTEKGKSFFSKIHRSLHRLTNMIDGTLAYAQVDVKDLAIEVVELHDIIQAVREELEIIIDVKQAAFKTGTLPAIEGARPLLYQLFYNLINNALKFSSQERSPVIEISASLNADGDKTIIVVADNGIGFDPTYASVIFKAYTRLNSKDKYDGTGLGLSLCKKIVDRHHGSIEATAEPDKGATFTIALPLRQSALSPNH